MSLDPVAVKEMAENYAKAWSSQNAQSVAAFYDENGKITANDGDPVIGRAAFAEFVQGFFDEFPDLAISLDEVRTVGNRAVFLWTLEGTNKETNNFVRLSGWESWLLSDEILVLESEGRFDAEEYERQVREGI
ncbi:MAG: nuclear transport factor 2 family protein [Rhizobiales bacterium]|nr:nuclear transport factor 2 family protein [Hyphomicrobiales bacterium]